MNSSYNNKCIMFTDIWAFRVLIWVYQAPYFCLCIQYNVVFMPSVLLNIIIISEGPSTDFNL